MPSPILPITRRLQGTSWHTRAIVTPGTTLRIDLVAGCSAWTLFALNSATAGIATLSATCDDAVPARGPAVIVPLGISADGTLAPGAVGTTGGQTPIRAVIVTVPAGANGDTVVVVVQ